MFWFRGEILLVIFFWTVVSNILRLLSNAIMIMFTSIPRLLLARLGQNMDKSLATDVLKTKVKISLFTFAIHGTVHSEILPI